MGTGVSILEIYTRCALDDYTISTLDPLGADEFLVEDLPRLNAGGETDKIYRVFGRFLSFSSSSWSKLEAAAATRDVAMVASSLVKHTSSLHQFPEIENVLMELSKITGEVPADTVTSYGPRNPAGRRMRTFTGEPEERFFISCVVEGMRSLPLAVSLLDVAQEYPLDSPEFPYLVGLAADNFDVMTNSMAKVRKRITPEYFTGKLRPYFEPKIVGGRKYLAPGGAQMPIVLIDLALWGGEDNNPQYIRYWKENVEYLPAVLRLRAQKISSSGSLLQKIKKEFQNRRVVCKESVRASLDAAEKLVVALLKFRYPHLKVAEDNMAIRPQGALGSGGYDTTILRLLIASSESARQTIQELKKLTREDVCHG